MLLVPENIDLIRSHYQYDRSIKFSHKAAIFEGLLPFMICFKLTSLCDYQYSFILIIKLIKYHFVF